MWQKAIKKTIYTLNINNYAPEILDITFPLLKRYAKKIGADIHTIKERKFPQWPLTYEKLQIYDLAQEMENDWNIYIDSDTLIHPETIDFTQYISKDTVAHNGSDMAAIRWKYDRFFLRDGRNIGSCTWMVMASDWCIDIFRPLDDLTIEEALSNIHPTVEELNTVITTDHLIDDYTMSRNIAKYGLKFTTLVDVQNKVIPGSNFFWHIYTVPKDEKIKQMKEIVTKWKMEQFIR
jgi:hypothetical protein